MQFGFRFVYHVAIALVVLNPLVLDNKALMQPNVTVRLVGNPKHLPKAESVSLTAKGALQDVYAHVYTDQQLEALLKSKDVLGEDNVRYLNLIVPSDETVTLEVVHQVSARITKLADPNTKTVITISFQTIVVKP